MSACQARWVAALARGLCLSLSLAMMPAIAMAAAAEADTSLETISAREQAVMATRTFLNAHPDLKYRNEGWEAYQAGDHVAAMAHFTKASLYADKASQAMVAEMTWKGQGVPEDRAMAYAWADLAAERGYVQFVKLREQYWRALDVAQRERAVQQGSALVADYAGIRPKFGPVTVDVDTTQAIGVPADQVEALAFAWLAACRLQGRPASLPGVTGARAARVLGAVFAAPPP